MTGHDKKGARRMASRRQILGLALIGATLIGAACSSDSDSSNSTSPDVSAAPTTAASETTAAPATSNAPATSSTESADGFSVAASLQQLPAVLGEAGDESAGIQTQIAVSDLDAATTLAGVERPADGSVDADAVQQWLLAINRPGRAEGGPAVAALLPEAAHADRAALVADFVDELGWSISDVHSFVEYQVPPNVFTVMSGGFSADALTAAMGAPTDDVWRVGGDDFSTDLAHVSAARPLGEALRMSLRGDTLAVARSTPPIEAWIAHDVADASGTLADDAGLIGVAGALDAADVYTAMLVEGDFSSRSAEAPPQTTGPASSAGLGPFTALGIGQTVDDDTPLAVLAYYFDDEASATAAVDRLSSLIENGVSDRTESPWSDAFAIRDISSAGHVLTATLEMKDFLPASLWNILFARDNLVVSSTS
jgi:hypothetical protein